MTTHPSNAALPLAARVRAPGGSTGQAAAGLSPPRPAPGRPWGRARRRYPPRCAVRPAQRGERVAGQRSRYQAALPGFPLRGRLHRGAVRGQAFPRQRGAAICHRANPPGGGGGNPGPAEQRLRPRCPTELRRPRGAEEARPRPPCGGMAAAPRCGEWRRPGAVPLKLLALLALAGAAGAGQLSKWRVPVPMVSAGTAGRLRGREAPGALLVRRGTWRSRPRSTWGPSARIQPRSAVTAGQREAAVRAARTERLRDARGARTGGSGPAARLGPGVGRAGPGGAEREARGFPCFCAALCVKLRGENCVKLGLSCRRREQCVFPVRMGAKLQELG